MTDDVDLRTKLRSEIDKVDAAALVPHHHRGALVIAEADVDLLAIAVAVAIDDTELIERLLSEGRLRKPTLPELADWCVDKSVRFQFVIVQPFVLAQLLPK